MIMLDRKQRLAWMALALILAAVLGTLAVLQYRWSGQASEAASGRLRASLRASINAFREDFYRDLAGVCMALQSPPMAVQNATPEEYAQRLQAWIRAAQHPGMVQDVYLWQDVGTSHAQLFKFQRDTGEFVPGSWPQPLTGLAEHIEGFSAAMPTFARRNEERHGVGKRERAGHGPGPHLGMLPPWFFEQNLPALVHPVSHPGEEKAGTDWIVVQLDAKFLAAHVLPELANRYFSGSNGLDYDVAVVSAGAQRLIFSSDPHFGPKVDRPDAEAELFLGPRRVREAGGAGVWLGEHGYPPPHGEPEEAGEGYVAMGGMPRLEPLHIAPAGGNWQLVVKHRRGSLDATVASMRRRNLAVSFGVLLLLAVTMGMIIVLTQRAHRLARLQMDFVTGVSHELRTPLAVISSAADNLADGVVDSPGQRARYGQVIKAQARQLTRLVEQIMLFAAARETSLRYDLKPLRPAEIVDAALANTADLAQAAHAVIEKDLEANLPAVRGDLAALSHCVQNLITNALKYGGEDRWIGVKAALAGNEVTISVADHGAGIASIEQERIFEPFYRTTSATAAQVHGAGLGLTLARSIVEAMAGRLTVESAPGMGSRFTVHLPAENGALPAGDANPAGETAAKDA